MRTRFPSRLAATSFAALALTAGGARAMDTCSGNYSATLLHPLALPTIVGLDLSDNSATTIRLGQAFTGGMKDAGIAVTGTPTVTLRVTYDVAGQGGSTPGGGAMTQAGNPQSGWSSWSGGQMAALQGGITLAMPDIPNYTMFRPQQPAVRVAHATCRSPQCGNAGSRLDRGPAMHREDDRQCRAGPRARLSAGRGHRAPKEQHCDVTAASR
jgi:hypothetical protein